METLYRQLGFETVKEKLAGYALTENGKRQILQLRSFLPLETYRKEQTLTLEMRDLLALDTALPMLGFASQTDRIKSVRVRGTALGEEELWVLADILLHGRLLYAYFQDRENKYPSLKDLVSVYNPDLELLEKSVFALFNSERRIADHASPLLASLRKKIVKLEHDIRTKVSQIAAQWTEESIAAEDAVAFRNGRQVIPIRASRKSKAPGIIHDQSQTGQTVYVEPMVIVEMNNDLYQARQAEHAEVHRILLEITGKVREYLPAVEALIRMMENLDLIHAKGQLSIAYHCDMPGYSTRHLHIKNGRNLELHFTREPVPLNLSLPGDKCGIIITGPNAGGKTVTLKTIGLLAVMNQAGMLIPAEASSLLPEYDQIFVDIGDGQSIDGGLSTFSSHILSLKHIVEKATRNSLVLIDELGTGTDPDEGAALAEGLLKVLSERGTTVIATTHHGALKTLAFENPLFENGSMNFNDRNLEPNYEFILGIPGSSYAIEIATRYRLDERVIAHARERVGKQREKLERLILDLQRKIARYDLQLKETRQLENEYRDKLDYINEKKGDIDHKYKHAEKEAVKKADSMIADLRRELEASIREIRERQASTSAIKNAQTVFRSAENLVREKRVEKPDLPASKLKLSDLSAGMDVFVVSMGQNGRILEINPKTKKIWVDVDGSRLRLQVDWLEPPRKIRQRTFTSLTYSQEGSAYRLDLRGKRAGDALAETDKFIDQAVLSGMSHLEILHGTGNGILQKIIHDLLSKDRRVADYQFAAPEQGGVGVTLVKLRE
ncbi:MAG: endonuclease MutS2 [Candidatus Marinimicrobia bacterium]|nr:endonuclease MutS2 [Candidatus Neomarinimicrobiota bacterium]